MTTLEEIAVPGEARCTCSGSSLPRSTYSQEIIFWTSLGGRVGIPEIVLDPEAATDGMPSRFSIAARRSAINSSPRGWGGVPLAAVETTLVEEEDTVVTVKAAELVVELEELPSSADIPGRDNKLETRVQGLIRLDRKVGKIGC